MTRAWGSFTRSKCGAFKRRDSKARGPSRIIALGSEMGDTPEIDNPGTCALNAELTYQETFHHYECEVWGGSAGQSDIDRTVGRAIFGSLDLDAEEVTDTDYKYIDATHCPYHYTAASAPLMSNGFLWPMLHQVGDAYGWGGGTILPYDANEAALYAVVMCHYILPADRNTPPPTCAKGWTPTDPPAAMVYQPASAGTDASLHYHVWKRDDVESEWEEVDAPFDADTSGLSGILIAQSTGKLWSEVDAATDEVHGWPIETAYEDATPTVLTLTASTVYWFQLWGPYILVCRNDGELEIFTASGTLGTLPAPLDPATWNAAHMLFGWIAIRHPGTVQFWKLADDESGATHHQTLEEGFSTVWMVAEDHAIAKVWGRWSLLIFDHATSAWLNGGGIPHLNKRCAAGWSVSYTINRYAVITKSGDTDLVQVC